MKWMTWKDRFFFAGIAVVMSFWMGQMVNATRDKYAELRAREAPPALSLPAQCLEGETIEVKYWHPMKDGGTSSRAYKTWACMAGEGWVLVEDWDEVNYSKIRAKD